jgi:hypothetical protein
VSGISEERLKQMTEASHDPAVLEEAEKRLFSLTMAFVEQIMKRALDGKATAEDATTSAGAVLAFHMILANRTLGIPSARTHSLQDSGLMFMAGRLDEYAESIGLKNATATRDLLNKRADLN